MVAVDGADAPRISFKKGRRFCRICLLPAFARIHIQRFTPRADICGKLADPFRIPKREPKCVSQTPSRLAAKRDIFPLNLLEKTIVVSVWIQWLITIHRDIACFPGFYVPIKNFVLHPRKQPRIDNAGLVPAFPVI